MKRIIALFCLIVFIAYGMPVAFAEDITNNRDLSQDIEAPKIEEYNGENLADYGNWELAYFVDKFKQPIDEMYVRNITPFIGSFDNNVVNDAILYADVFVDLNVNASEDNPEDFFVWIRLLEYGMYRVKNTSDTYKEYSVLIMDCEGERYEFEAYMNSKSDYIFFRNKPSYEIIEILKKGGRVYFAILDPENPLVSYQFVIDDTTGFDSAYARETIYQYSTAPLASRLKGMYYSADEWFSSDEMCACLLYALLEDSGHLEGFLENENVEDVFILNYGTNFAIYAPYGDGTLGYMFFPGNEPISMLVQEAQEFKWTEEAIEALEAPYRTIDSDTWAEYLSNITD